MGYALTAMALLVLYFLVIFFNAYFDYSSSQENAMMLMDALAGYGLGGSSIAMFGRVGGGIYTKVCVCHRVCLRVFWCWSCGDVAWLTALLCMPMMVCARLLMLAPTWWARWRSTFPRTTLATLAPLLTTSATTSVMSLAWELTCSAPSQSRPALPSLSQPPRPSCVRSPCGSPALPVPPYLPPSPHSPIDWL